MIVIGSRKRTILFLVLAFIIAAGVTGGAIAAPDNSGTAGSGEETAVSDHTDCIGTATGACGEGKTAGAPKELTTTLFASTLKGGYVAKGVATRNRGSGNIVINTIPPNSTVQKAYLFWAIISPSSITGTPPVSYRSVTLNGTVVTGTLIGSANQPCWGGGKIYVYRADVTTLVKGNNTYRIGGIDSGRTDGTDPWVTSTTFPLSEGASLVIVYANELYPRTRILIRNGAETTDTWGGSLTTTYSGLPAYAKPVAYTTWVVADGQTTPEYPKTVDFNGVTMPSTYLNGYDPKTGGGRFSKGNLWDTQNALVKITPGATSASTTIHANGDCVTWVAQVLSVSNGNLDTDGDALLDSWEIYGYDYNNDGTIDVNLPALGASPYHKDLFVEIDYMPGHKPNATVLARSVATFANAPYANNPDKKPGIKLHNKVDSQVPHDNDLNPVWTDVDAIKATYFPLNRRAIYHYCLFAHGYGGGSSSGISRGIPASDFIVTLGLWGVQDNDNAKTGTYVHEFGHNLGLTHGGTDHVNYKPNYLSIMNYFFQINGLYRGGSWGNYDYQRITPYTLNENSLYETNGVGTAANGYRTKYYSPGGTERSSTSNKPIDWTWNSTIDTSPVKVDLNKDGSRTVLTSQLNWKYIVYNGGDVGGVSAAEPKAQIMKAENMPACLDYQEYRQNVKAMDEE